MKRRIILYLIISLFISIYAITLGYYDDIIISLSIKYNLFKFVHCDFLGKKIVDGSLQELYSLYSRDNRRNKQPLMDLLDSRNTDKALKVAGVLLQLNEKNAIPKLIDNLDKDYYSNEEKLILIDIIVRYNDCSLDNIIEGRIKTALDKEKYIKLKRELDNNCFENKK